MHRWHEVAIFKVIIRLYRGNLSTGQSTAHVNIHNDVSNLSFLSFLLNFFYFFILRSSSSCLLLFCLAECCDLCDLAFGAPTTICYSLFLHPSICCVFATCFRITWSGASDPNQNRDKESCSSKLIEISFHDWKEITLYWAYWLENGFPLLY
jgi:hypothetical protein